MDDFFEQYENLMRAIEQTRLLMNPYHRVHDELVRWREQSHATVLGPTQAIDAVVRQEQSLSTIRDLTASLRMFEQIREDHEYVMSLVSPYQQFAESLDRQITIWQNLMKPGQNAVSQLGLTMARIHEASLVWNCSLTQTVQRFQEVGLFAEKEDLSLRLLEPPRVYTEFVEQTVRRIEQSGSEQIAKALRASLYLAEGQLLAMTDVMSTIVTVPADDELVLAVRPLRAPFVQRDELLAVTDISDEEDEAALTRLSPAAGAANDSRIVLSLITQCNEAAKVAGQPEIFKPTTRLLEVFADLPWVIPMDKQTFADFVDCLYFIFYEGAGKDNLRFLSANGGVLDEADCDFIWCIKHLRNKWLRHDADHGKEAAIRKSWEELAANFNWLDLRHIPAAPNHFRYLHCRLLKEAEAFLQKILDKLTNDK